jgi:hypothetical protein
MSNDTQEELHRLRQADRVLTEFVIEEMCKYHDIRKITLHDVLFEILRKYYKDRVNDTFADHNRGAQDIIKYLLHKIEPICEGASKAFGREYTWRSVRMNFIHDSIEAWFKAEAWR